MPSLDHWLVDEKDDDSVSLEISYDSDDSINPDDPNKTSICQKCGDKGYSRLLIFCDVCHVAAEHVYCLDRSKVDVKVESWTCLECRQADSLSISNITLTPTLGDKQIEVEQKPTLGDKQIEVEQKPQDSRRRGCDYDDASEKDLPSQPKYSRPIRDPIWRGSFEISGREYGPLVGHISNKACPRVSQAAKELPSLLRMEMSSRTHVWPKKFDLKAPTDDAIALYFFSDKQREKNGFTELVDGMKNKDLALKFVFADTELLIFPSVQLPELYWKFHGADYLWGAFRKRKVPVHQ